MSFLYVCGIWLPCPKHGLLLDGIISHAKCVNCAGSICGPVAAGHWLVGVVVPASFLSECCNWDVIFSGVCQSCAQACVLGSAR